MSVLEDSDTEITKAFDERVRLRRRKVLSDITNTPDIMVGNHKKNGNVLVNALHDPTLYYSYADPRKIPMEGRRAESCRPEGSHNMSLEMIESPVRDGFDLKVARQSHGDGDDTNTCNKQERLETHGEGVTEGGRKKVVFRDDGSDGKGAKGNGAGGAASNVDPAEGPTHLKDPEGEADGRIHRDEEMEDQKKMLSRIQRELDELKEAHRRALRVKSKLIKVMEKEVEELKRRLEAKREEEIECLKRHYNEMLIAKREAYKEACRQKMVEYKNALDDAYKKKAAEYQSKCNNVISRLKKLYKERRRGSCE